MDLHIPVSMYQEDSNCISSTVVFFWLLMNLGISSNTTQSSHLQMTISNACLLFSNRLSIFYCWFENFFVFSNNLLIWGVQTFSLISECLYFLKDYFKCHQICNFSHYISMFSGWNILIYHRIRRSSQIWF
jgi:hypothetical protein